MIGQRETIKQILEDNQWHCGTEFQKLYIPEYRTRINELRKKDCIIEKRRCQQHHHKGVMQEWKLVEQKANAPMYTTAGLSDKVCCASFVIFQIHERACQGLKEPAKPTLF
jgi:hypothetical protein